MCEWLFKSKWGGRVLNVVFVVAVLGAVTWASYSLFNPEHEETAPRVVSGLWIEPTTIRPGGTFRVHVTGLLTRLCPREVHWAISRKPDNLEIVKIIDPPQPPQTVLGAYTAITPHTIPFLAPGEYRYSAVVYDTCPDHTYVSVRKGVDLTV